MSARGRPHRPNGLRLVGVLLAGPLVACTSHEDAGAPRPDAAIGSGGSTGGSSGGSTGGSSGGSTGGSSGGGTGGAPGGGTGGASGGGTGGSSTSASGSVLQHHNNASRDGVYIDSKLTKTAVSSLHIDSSFANATINGPTYAQPLYLAGAAGKPNLVIAATEQNEVDAFNAADGSKVWTRTLGTPMSLGDLPCGNIDPLGVTGTPVIDGSTRTIFLDAMISEGSAAHHRVFALDADTGTTQNGWPVDMNTTVTTGTTQFDSSVQNQRGALLLLNGSLFVPFGGFFGDCGTYHGWIVGIQETNPSSVIAWATRAIAGGVWAPGGIASDGTSLFFATGNTEGAANSFSAPGTWQDGDAIFRLAPNLTFSGNTSDYFAPSDWQTLDNTDQDLGGSNPVVIDVPGATPQQVVVALGKDGKAYVLDRSTLGGIGGAIANATVAQGSIINAPAAYTTPNGTYVVFKGTGQGCPSGQSGGLTAIRIGAGNPSVAWCAGPTTQDSPSVSMTDNTGSNAIVWIVGRDYKLYGLDGDTGATVFGGGTTAMSSVQKFQTPIIVGGRVFVAAGDRVYAFAL